ncbi:hypothetical protein LCGC14_0651190 [marine sediment metagenome]|uniref:Uncharacterized protein n=1 Tax=marine sediment metagenome TaxID=412755 RepID=A0A0F9QW84_9ZZZZ
MEIKKKKPGCFGNCYSKKDCFSCKYSKECQKKLYTEAQ